MKAKQPLYYSMSSNSNKPVPAIDELSCLAGHVSPLLLSLPVVNKSNFHNRISLRNDNSSGIVSLPINSCKSPNLLARPALLLVLNIALNVKLASWSALLLVALKPPFLQEIIVGNIQSTPSALALQLSKQMVLMLPELPVQLAELRCAFDAASCGLINVDVCVSSIIGVLLDMQSDGCEGDCFASQPADALECEDRISVVR